MRHIIYDRTKADAEISAPGENLWAYQKVRWISYAPVKKLGAHQKVRRISSAPACYLGSAESPTADFLQIWLKSSRSSDVPSHSCRPQVIWRLRPLCFYGQRLSRTVPACCTGTTCQNLRGCQNLCARLGFHHFKLKIQNSISASRCPITAPKIRTWSQLLSKFSYNTHRLLNGGRPRFWPSLPESAIILRVCKGGGGAEIDAGRLPLITFIGGEREGVALQLFALHMHAVLFLVPLSPFSILQ